MSETTYDPGTDPAVVKVLESVINTRKRVRLWFGDTATGRDWLEENDVTGCVSRSMGPQKAPILLANERSVAGGAILTARILAIQVEGRIEYKHPRYQAPNLTLCKPEMPGYKSAAARDGELVAQFKTADGAQRWIDFMLVNRRGK